VDDISDQQLLKAYMDGLKQDIKRDIFLRHPTNIMESIQKLVIFKKKIRLHTNIPLEHTQQVEIVLWVIQQAYLNQQG
jgi:hypothetical protein